MKKLYFLSFFCCLSFAALSQSMTVTVNATGTTGSFKTGYIDNSTTPTRHDGNLQVQQSATTPVGDQRGWAVFNLPSVLQPSATVTAVKLRFTISNTANSVNASQVGIFGYLGDLSGVTNPSTVYTDLNGSTSYVGSNFSNTQWGAAPATDLITFNSNGVGFMNTYATATVSLGWQCNSDPGQVYTIVGEGGTAATQPQLEITYNCIGVSGVSAAATPTVCAGDALSLTSTGTGTVTYAWSGPGGYTSTLQNPTLTATAASAGVYTLVASNPGGCGVTATTTSVTVNPLPAPITGAPVYLCVNSFTTVSDATPLGVWSATSTTVATIDPIGTVTGASPGNVTITYTLPTTCFSTHTVEVVARPVTITGPASVCVSQVITLSISSEGGTWSSSNPSLAAINSIANVLGISMGTPVISYMVSPDCYSVRTLTVNPLAPITGVSRICLGATTYLADIVGSGTWTSTQPAVASIGSLDGFVSGQSTGTTNISYTTPQGCITTHTLGVVAYPSAITGIMRTCPGATTRLSDATASGVWSSSNTGVATVTSTGTVHGVFADTVSINYTVAPGCAVTTTLIVNPLPDTIVSLSGLCVTAQDSVWDATPLGVWSTGTPTLATITSTGVVTGISGGDAVIFYTLPATGCRISDTMTVHPLPVPIITYFWQTGTLYVQTYYYTYQWYDDLEGLIPGATSPNVAALYTENYWVVVTDSFGCTNTSAHYFFDATLLGVQNVSEAQIKVFPNPASSIVNIEAPVNVRAVISGIDGKVLLQLDNAKEINISSLAEGMYFITLYNDDKQAITTRKLIKQ